LGFEPELLAGKPRVVVDAIQRDVCLQTVLSERAEAAFRVWGK
jgi:hypothetical protein